MHEVVGGSAQPARVAPVEVDPPQPDRPDEGGHKGGHLGAVPVRPTGQHRPRDDDRCAESDQQEGPRTRRARCWTAISGFLSRRGARRSGQAVQPSLLAATSRRPSVSRIGPDLSFPDARPASIGHRSRQGSPRGPRKRAPSASGKRPGRVGRRPGWVRHGGDRPPAGGRRRRSPQCAAPATLYLTRTGPPRSSRRGPASTRCRPTGWS